jgi:hypothetical protein
MPWRAFCKTILKDVGVELVGTLYFILCLATNLATWFASPEIQAEYRPVKILTNSKPSAFCFQVAAFRKAMAPKYEAKGRRENNGRFRATKPEATTPGSRRSV